VREIHDEIRALQADPEAFHHSSGFSFMRWFLMLPAFLRDVFYSYLYANPHLIKRHTGTVVLTAVGMFGQGGGWGIPIPSHNVNVTLGGIAQKPGVANGEIALREMLDVTLSFNHDTVDGAPAARFARRFKEMIEGSEGLTAVVEVTEDETAPIHCGVVRSVDRRLQPESRTAPFVSRRQELRTSLHFRQMVNLSMERRTCRTSRREDA
jgi:hypothetical protein